MHNLYKIKRVLEKINYSGQVQNAALEQGDPKLYTEILKFLVFRSSRAMREHLEAKGISLQSEYLPDHKFYKALADLCANLFAYRLPLSTE